MEPPLLYESIRQQNVFWVRDALKTHGDVNEEYGSKTPLNLLCTLKMSNITFDVMFEMLLSKGANPLQRRKLDDLPLHWVAAEVGNLHACKRLFAHIPPGRLDEFTCSETGASSLYVAAQNGHYDLVAFLLSEQGFDPNKATTYSMTPLQSCVVDAREHKNEAAIEKMVRLLLDAGADPLIEYKNRNALEMAKYEPVQLLLLQEFVVRGWFEASRYNAIVWQRFSASTKRSLYRWVNMLLEEERAVFAALFNETCDLETSFQSEVFGPVAEELASMVVLPTAAARRALRYLEYLFYSA